MTKRILLSAFLLLSLVISIGGAPADAATQIQQNEIVFTIPVGENGIYYEGVGVPEMLTWGPAAFTVSPDGSFWIADTVGNRLLHFDSHGGLLEKINLDGYIVGASDLVVTKSGVITVLDQASMPPKIVQFASGGGVLGRHELPDGLRLGDGLSGISLGDQGEVLVEREGGAYVQQFLGAHGNPVQAAPTKGNLHNDKLYRAHPSGLTSANPKQGTFQAGDITIEVNTAHDLGTLTILGFGPDNSLYVVLEELAQNPNLQVDKTIRHYDAQGSLMGIARMPLAEQYTYVAHGLSIGPDGSVYALATYPDHAEILRLAFESELNPILSDVAIPFNIFEDTLPESGESITACVSRDAMVNTAYSYCNNSKYLNNTNINGSCSNRTKPRYLGSAGTYTSVSYDWWGFDTVSGWNNYMTNNYQAGDIDTSGNEGCSRRVDCSGYVSRAWQLGERYGTCTIENISTQLGSVNLLQRGDILNKCNDHTVLFRDFGYEYGGLFVYESTTVNAYDRAVYTWNEWSRFSGYNPRKYNNVCQ